MPKRRICPEALNPQAADIQANAQQNVTSPDDLAAHPSDRVGNPLASGGEPIKEQGDEPCDVESLDDVDTANLEVGKPNETPVSQSEGNTTSVSNMGDAAKGSVTQTEGGREAEGAQAGLLESSLDVLQADGLDDSGPKASEAACEDTTRREGSDMEDEMEEPEAAWNAAKLAPGQTKVLVGRSTKRRLLVSSDSESDDGCGAPGPDDGPHLPHTCTDDLPSHKPSEDELADANAAETLCAQTVVGALSENLFSTQAEQKGLPQDSPDIDIGLWEVPQPDALPLAASADTLLNADVEDLRTGAQQVTASEQRQDKAVQDDTGPCAMECEGVGECPAETPSQNPAAETCSGRPSRAESAPEGLGNDKETKAKKITSEIVHLTGSASEEDSGAEEDLKGGHHISPPLKGEKEEIQQQIDAELQSVTMVYGPGDHVECLTDSGWWCAGVVHTTEGLEPGIVRVCLDQPSQVCVGPSLSPHLGYWLRCTFQDCVNSVAIALSLEA